jgi:hypothetical protein
MGRHRIKWTKENDAKLLYEISQGKSQIQVTISMNISIPTIKRRLREMGFENFLDARNVMTS